MDARAIVKVFRVKAVSSNQLLVEWIWNESVDLIRLVQNIKIIYQLKDSTAISRTDVDHAQRSYILENLEEETFYRVCIEFSYLSDKPQHVCEDASTQMWHLPASIGGTVGAFLALALIIIVVVLSVRMKQKRKGLVGRDGTSKRSRIDSVLESQFDSIGIREETSFYDDSGVTPYYSDANYNDITSSSVGAASSVHGYSIGTKLTAAQLSVGTTASNASTKLSATNTNCASPLFDKSDKNSVDTACAKPQITDDFVTSTKTCNLSSNSSSKSVTFKGVRSNMTSNNNCNNNYVTQDSVNQNTVLIEPCPLTPNLTDSCKQNECQLTSLYSQDNNNDHGCLTDTTTIMPQSAFTCVSPKICHQIMETSIDDANKCTHVFRHGSEELDNTSNIMTKSEKDVNSMQNCNTPFNSSASNKTQGIFTQIIETI